MRMREKFTLRWTVYCDLSSKTATNSQLWSFLPSPLLKHSSFMSHFLGFSANFSITIGLLNESKSVFWQSILYFLFSHLKNWNFKQQVAIDVRIFRPFHVDFHWPNFDIHCDIWHRSNFWNFYPQNKQQPMECDFTEHRFTAIGWTCHKGMSFFFTVMPNI